MKRGAKKLEITRKIRNGGCRANSLQATLRRKGISSNVALSPYDDLPIKQVKIY
jgi:hypothetical protein